MGLEDARWMCVWCGTAVDIPLDAVPEVIFTAASGKPTYRILMLRGVEVHRCKTQNDEHGRAF